MNEKDMTDLLHRATRDLAPDVEGMVTGGLRRGRVRQRRRRTTATIATGAVAVLLVVGGLQVLGAEGTGRRSVAPADPAPPSVTASPTPTDTAGPSPTTKAELAVTTEQVPTTFASLAPGRVSAPSPKSGPDEAPVVDFTWEGFGIRVGITPDDYVEGHPVPDPATRCAEQSSGRPCRPGPDGTVTSTSDMTQPAVDGGTRVRSVAVFRPDGWDVLVMAYNGPGKDGPATAQEPPFDLQELRRIAASDAWFR